MVLSSISPFLQIEIGSSDPKILQPLRYGNCIICTGNQIIYGTCFLTESQIGSIQPTFLKLNQLRSAILRFRMVQSKIILLQISQLNLDRYELVQSELDRIFATPAFLQENEATWKPGTLGNAFQHEA